MWQRASDPRLFLAAGYALLLQVAHPVVASGVRDHSTFESDPLRRLLGTLDYVNLAVYGGTAGLAAAERLRRLHEGIRGTNPDGSSYSALDPEAFAWVHATILEAIVRAHDRFGRPLERVEQDALYSEWLVAGDAIGVDRAELPASWAAFHGYLGAMVAHRLERNQTVDRVIDALRSPPAPPGTLRRYAWYAARVPLSHFLLLAASGLLPPQLRDRFGLEWGPAQERELKLLGMFTRSLTPLMPAWLRVTGPGYLQLRRRPIAAGPLAPPVE